MTYLASLWLGAMSIACGFMTGLAAGGMAILLGPRVGGIVPHWVSSAFLAGMGCAVLYGLQRDAARIDPAQTASDLAVLGLGAGYAAACALVLTSGIFWHSDVAAMRAFARGVPGALLAGVAFLLDLACRILR